MTEASHAKEVAKSPMAVMESLGPEIPLEQRWLEMQPLSVRVAHQVFEKKGVRTALLAVGSLMTGMLARGFQPGSLESTLLNRVPGIVGVDTGPTDVLGGWEMLPEIASGALAMGALLYGLGGVGVDAFLFSQAVDKGQAPVPGTLGGLRERALSGKPWENHLIVIDPHRLVFDTLSNQNPKQQMVLMHSGEIMKDGLLTGGNLGPKAIRRHIDSAGIDHLSDADVLALANPGKADKVVINMWQPDQALYSARYAKTDGGLSAEKADNMLRTIADNWPDREVEIILPKDQAWAYGLAANLFKDEHYDGKVKLSIRTPEEKVIDLLAKKMADLGEGKTLWVESDIEKEEVIGFRPGEKLRYKLTEDFHKDLQSKGVKIADYLRKADVIGVYCSTDDLSNARAAELKREFPDKEVIVMIERRSNIDEAKSTGAVPWFLPEIVVS